MKKATQENNPPLMELRRLHLGRVNVPYYYYEPPGCDAAAPTWVCVHGINRQARPLADAFCVAAQMAGRRLVVPQFSAGYFPDFQRLGTRGRGLRADQALDAILEALDLPAQSSQSLALFGFSGGAQFAHR